MMEKSSAITSPVYILIYTNEIAYKYLTFIKVCITFLIHIGFCPSKIKL